MKRILKLTAAVMAMVMMFSAVGVTTAFAADNASHGKKIMSYLPGWGDWKSTDIKGDKLTHVLISFARIDNSFKISDKEVRMTVEGRADLPLPDLASAPLISSTKWSEIKKLQTQYPDLKFIIAVGGWAADGFSDMAATQATRQIFVDSVVQYVKAHDLDGIDIDWEYPVNGGWGVIKAREVDKENFTKLIKLLRQELGTDKEISFCASVGGYFLEAVELAEVSKYVDSVNVMAYDMQGVWHENTDHHTNLYSNPENPFASWGLSSSESVDRIINAGVPKEKIVLGAAAYGHEFANVSSDDNNGLFQAFNKEDSTIWRGGSIPYTILEKYYINKNGFTRHYDKSAEAPYLYSETENIFITYDDPQSVTAKAKYAKESGLGGLMYWEYTNDIQGKLLDAMFKELNK